MDLTNLSRKNLHEFAEYLEEMQSRIEFKVSARGWAYLLEGERMINKDQFDKVENYINTCRRKGILPVDFVAEEKSRMFSGVEKPTGTDIVTDFGDWIDTALNAPSHYTPDWWDGEEYYIQMVVEKVDLISLFEPVCRAYHIPIANAKGWSSLYQRAEYARRFADAEERGLQPVLLYCGDHDPDGLRISDFLRKNLVDVKNVRWDNGDDGYDPEGLIVQRFGLEYDFIMQHSLTWIDNLITGSGKNLASKQHKNHGMPYVQAYLKNFGARKVEANALVTRPEAARDLVTEVIQSFVGPDAIERFEAKTQLIQDEFDEFMSSSGLSVSFENALRIIRNRR